MMPNDFPKHSDFLKRVDLEAEAFEKEKERNDRQTALIFAVLIALLAGTGIILVASSNRTSGPSELRDCASIESGTERLACFDELSRHAASPFKGAPPAELSGKK
ncbi:hypothetical protein [Hyphomicrobium sp. 99]|uniref:hypothetical protein n=1 Tax=Hyphomicrobium sp. 99 TaxID=1163419 RepID=UPI0005F82FED|nr:hypothetical protein [Hyphomicrobium sp. 99]